VTSRRPGVLVVLVFVSSAVLLRPAAAAAQTPGQTLSDVLAFLVANQTVATGDFAKDRAAADATRDAIASAVAVTLATIPQASSSGGFVYRFNPALGTAERVSDSFGPAYVERALVAPRGQMAVGVTVRSLRLDRLDATRLDEEGVVTIANRFGDEAAPFDVETLVLDLRATTVTLTASSGIGGGLEIGAAVPFVRIAFDGARTDVYRGQTFVQAGGSATASGIGDIALRAKYRLAQSDAGSVSAGADLRLPTGREEDLLGAGTRALRMLLIGSLERGPIAVHGNGSITVGDVADGWGVAGALSVAAAPRVTMFAETILDRLDRLGRLETAAAPHPSIAGVETVRLAPRTDGATRALAAAGFKWNVAGPWIIGGQVLWPLTKRGLNAGPAPVVALERAF
jgi:hypothetical protein